METKVTEKTSIMQVLKKSQTARKRPLSGQISNNSRDPNWMKLFHLKKNKGIQFKHSKYLPYTLKSSSSVIEIQPKFVINAMRLYKVLVNEPQNENFAIRKTKTLQRIPEYSKFSDKNISLSRVSFIKSDSRQNNTSRPSTATSRIVQKQRKPSEMEFLPDKGNEFLSEVLKLWENIDKKKEIQTDRYSNLNIYEEDF